MTAHKGSLVLIKVGDGGSPENFTTVGGLRVTGITLSNHMLDATTVQSGTWRQLLSGAGIQSLHLSGSGFFTDATSEETVRGYAFASSVNNYVFAFPNGDKVTGPFLIVTYERSGDVESEENYQISFESAGAMVFTKA